MKTYKMMIPGIALGLAPLALSPAFAQQAAEVDFYGQFNPVYQYVDDGADTFSTLADNTNSNTRIGMTVRTTFGPGELKFTLETALGLRSSAGVSQLSKPDGFDWRRTNIRKVDFQWSGLVGVYYIGQGSTASDGAGEVDFSGTGLVSYSSIAEGAGGFQFVTTAGALSGISLSNASGNFDGSRRARVRYDTPELSGFRFSLSYGQEVLRSGNDNDYYDVAVRYGKTFGDFKVAAAAAYAWVEPPAGTTSESFVTSAAVLHEPTGLSAAISAGERTQGGDASFWFAKLGYKTRILSAGDTLFSLDYYNGNDFVSLGDETESTALTVVQKFDKQRIEAYASLRQSSYDDASGTGFRDLDSVLIGARIKF